MPGQTVNQDAARIAKRIEQELSSFDSIMWGALAQKKANPQKRTEMVMNALSNLRDFVTGVLSTVGTQKIARPGTDGKKGKPMNVSSKLQADIAETKARIAKLKADSPFFVQGGGKVLPTIGAQELFGKPAEDATPEDLQTALDVLRETVASLLDEIDVLSASAPAAKTAADPNVGPFDGVFSRYGERQQEIVKMCKAAKAARAKAAKGNVWGGVWTGLPRA